MNATTSRTGATPKQEALIRKIAAELGCDAEAILADAYSPATASRAIEALISDSRQTRIAERALRPAAAPAVGPGYYLLDGQPVRVTLNKEGTRAYAKRLVIHTDETFTWEYQGGLIFRLSEDLRMTPEQAAAFTAETRHCAICGRHLRVKQSVERGIGPVCWGKLGG